MITSRKNVLAITEMLATAVILSILPLTIYSADDKFRVNMPTMLCLAASLWTVYNLLLYKQVDGNFIGKRFLQLDLKKFNIQTTTRIYSPRYGPNGYYILQPLMIEGEESGKVWKCWIGGFDTNAGKIAKYVIDRCTGEIPVDEVVYQKLSRLDTRRRDWSRK